MTLAMLENRICKLRRNLKMSKLGGERRCVNKLRGIG
jgi:hypothetical protein